MELSYTTDNITIDTGTLVIQGRFLEEDTSTTIAVSKNTAYNKLIIEINLDLENTDNNFVQAQYKIISSTNDYPALTQTDIVKNNAGIYQYELARFTTDISGIRSFEDKRSFVDYNSIYAMIQEMIENIESGSIYALKTELEDLQETLEAEMESLQQQISTNVQSQINTISESVSNLQASLNTTNTNVGKKTIYSDFAYSSVTASPQIAAGGNASATLSSSKSGYYPIGVIGVNNSGDKACSVERAQVTTRNNGSAVLSYTIHNGDAGNNRTASVTFEILWVKIR